ncbi:gamma-sarcoglycan-like [Cylas formicarius]|uniref:gamma-sarcoglycan-like n=1 Tax=Cylas formicarius TaxID=197179 RepID=UPI002958CF59|nr:gamma-sarcoglycan-like [Cylas formicarius]
MKKNEDEGATLPDHQSRIDASSDPSIILSTNKCHQGIRIGLFGWRKKCMYGFILTLLFMVIVNLALTLWVLKVMDFSPDGMGHLEIIPGGLKLKGNAYVLENLIATQIRSRRGDPVVVESSRNVTLKSRSSNGYHSSWIYLGMDQFECMSNNFNILDDRGFSLFSADRNGITIGADTLRVTGEGGSSFRGSVQATLIRAESGHDLRLESPTSTLSIKGPQGITLESRGGQIVSHAFNDIKFETFGGAIHLHSSVVVPHLPTAKISLANNERNFNVFQLCACESGKLFLASPHGVCVSDNDDSLCR